jgi:Nif-specific regulatory protein
VVAATNRDLEEAVRRGSFRLDLYHRVQVVEIVLPPLRERREDVPRLIEVFLADLAAEHGRRLLLTREAVERLAKLDWPGNVRQLRNVLERLVVSHGDGPVTASDLDWLAPGARKGSVVDDTAPGGIARPPGANGAATGIASGSAGAEVGTERDRVLEALERAGHVQARAARLLGLTVRQLRYRVAKFGIQVERF